MSAEAVGGTGVDLALIVVAYHSGQDLPPFIGSIDAAAGDATWHLTIVDNAPGDDDLTRLIGSGAHVHVVDAPGTLGYAGGLNLGLTHIPPARVIVFCNPDLTFEPGSLSALCAAVDGGVAAAVPLIVDPSGIPQPSLRREPRLLASVGEALLGDVWPCRPQRLAEIVRRPECYAVEGDTDWATGAVLAVGADTVRRVGPWDDGRFFMYSEETDYCRRIRDGGGVIRFVPSAVVRHRRGGSGSSPHLYALVEVNKVRYFQKWHGRTAATLFRAVVTLRNAVRPHRAGSRAAVAALLSERRRAALPGGPR